MKDKNLQEVNNPQQELVLQIAINKFSDGSLAMGITKGTDTLENIIGLLEMTKFDFLYNDKKQAELVPVTIDELDIELSSSHQTGLFKDKNVGDVVRLAPDVAAVREILRNTYIQSKESAEA